MTVIRADMKVMFTCNFDPENDMFSLCNSSSESLSERLPLLSDRGGDEDFLSPWRSNSFLHREGEFVQDLPPSVSTMENKCLASFFFSVNCLIPLSTALELIA